MTIVDKIIASVKGVLGEDFPVYYYDDFDMNMATSGMTFPCAFFQLIQRGTLVSEAGQLKERVYAGIFFVELAEWDCKATDNETIIDRCKRRGLFWLSQLSRDKYIEGRLLDTARKYADTDDIVTGWGAFLNVTELEGYSDCDEQVCPSDFNDDFNDDFTTAPIY